MMFTTQTTRRYLPMSATTLLALILSVSFSAATAGAPKLPTRPFLPLKLAKIAASAALQRCLADGYRVSVTIVSREGMTKIMLRSDGAGPHTFGSSRGKAFTAASLGRSSADFAKLIAARPGLAGLRDMDDRMVILGGGLPIKFGGVVVGGIGVGGAPGAQFDEACARQGLAAIKADN